MTHYKLITIYHFTQIERKNQAGFVLDSTGKQIQYSYDVDWWCSSEYRPYAVCNREGCRRYFQDHGKGGEGNSYKDFCSYNFFASEGFWRFWFINKHFYIIGFEFWQYCNQDWLVNNYERRKSQFFKFGKFNFWLRKYGYKEELRFNKKAPNRGFFYFKYS